MANDSSISFSDIADSKAFQDFFEIVRELTGIKISMANPEMTRRKALFMKSELNPLCTFLQTSPEVLKNCRHTDRINCSRAVKAEKGIYYTCHAGLMDIAVPIFVEGNHIATVNCGQMLPEQPTEENFRIFLKNNRKFLLSTQKLKEAYFKSPFITKNKMEKTVKLISTFADYFCEIGNRFKVTPKATDRKEIEDIKKYVGQHFREPVNLKEAARHVSLSPAYFSSIFKKITGMHFITYVQKIRVEEAKKLLARTDLAITAVSARVGFNNHTHFNYVFKKIEKTSPRDFRVRNNTEETKK